MISGTLLHLKCWQPGQTLQPLPRKWATRVSRQRQPRMPTSHLGAKSAPQTYCQVWCSLVQKKALTIERKGLYSLVPRDRIELPTRGFSVLRYFLLFQLVMHGAHQSHWCSTILHPVLSPDLHPPLPVRASLPSPTKKPPISERPSVFRLIPRSAVPATASVHRRRPTVLRVVQEYRAGLECRSVARCIAPV